MFFVLNTGRAGSKTAAKVLSQSPDCECLHEPEPRIIEEAARYRYGTIDPDLIVAKLRLKRATHPSLKYGETNNKLALIVPLLVRAFPDCRFVWLVRDGRHVVTSGHQRGWFGPEEHTDASGPWGRWRLQGDLVGDVPAAEWGRWDPFERCCWLWNYTNRLIQQDLSGLSPDRWQLVRIEELGASIEGLCDFLGTQRAAFVLDRVNGRRTGVAQGRANVVSSVSTWQEWSPSQREVFLRHCGALMDELYPNWRTGDEWRETPQEVGRESARSRRVTQPGTHDDNVAALCIDRAELKMLRGELRALTSAHAEIGATAPELSQLTFATMTRVRSVVRILERAQGRLSAAVTRLQDLERQVPVDERHEPGSGRAVTREPDRSRPDAAPGGRPAPHETAVASPVREVIGRIQRLMRAASRRRPAAPTPVNERRQQP
jgi:hypothetical protein